MHALPEASEPQGAPSVMLSDVVASELRDLGLADAVFENQQQAVNALPEYSVTVESRKLHKDIGETAFARGVQETVRLSDGAVRLLTRFTPKPRYFGKGNVSPYPLIGGGALATGPSGINAELMQDLALLGYPIEWLHHQGPHSLWPSSVGRLKTIGRFLSSKSVGKSAYHDHAVLDHIDQNGGVAYDPTSVLRDGFSRSAMSGEAFIALANRFGREVLYSDLFAKCFAKGYTPLGNAVAWAEQAPKELQGLVRLTREAIERELAGESGALESLVGTFHVHPLNIAHELAWIRPLISGDNGIYSEAIPLGTVGVRAFLSEDDMSQYGLHQLIHTFHPSLALIVEEGTHVEGASKAMRDVKVDRFRRVMSFMREHDMSLTGITPNDFLPHSTQYWRAGETLTAETA